MNTVLATQRQILLSLSRDELIAISNSVNEVLHNSTVDKHDCATRLGIEHDKLKELFLQITSVIDQPEEMDTEVFEVLRDGDSVQIRAISAFADPADLSLDEVRRKIEPLLSAK